MNTACCILFLPSVTQLTPYFLQVNGYGSAVAGQTVRGDIVMEVREDSLDGVRKSLIEVQEAVQRYSGEIPANIRKSKSMHLGSSASLSAPGTSGISNSEACTANSNQQQSVLAETLIGLETDHVIAAKRVCSGKHESSSVKPLRALGVGGEQASLSVMTEMSEMWQLQDSCRRQLSHGNGVVSHAQEGLASSAALRDEYEPRARLLWTTVGKITSVAFDKQSSSKESSCQRLTVKEGG
jgi:hypothetical protein